MLTLDEFVQQDIERTGKKVYTIADVCALTEKWIEIKKAAAAPFEGWREQQAEQAERGAP